MTITPWTNYCCRSRHGLRCPSTMWGILPSSRRGLRSPATPTRATSLPGDRFDRRPADLFPHQLFSRATRPTPRSPSTCARQRHNHRSRRNLRKGTSNTCASAIRRAYRRRLIEDVATNITSSRWGRTTPPKAMSSPHRGPMFRRSHLPEQRAQRRHRRGMRALPHGTEIASSEGEGGGHSFKVVMRNQRRAGQLPVLPRRRLP